MLTMEWRSGRYTAANELTLLQKVFDQRPE